MSELRISERKSKFIWGFPNVSNFATLSQSYEKRVKCKRKTRFSFSCVFTLTYSFDQKCGLMVFECMVGRVVMEFDVINVSKQNLSSVRPSLNAPLLGRFSTFGVPSGECRIFLRRNSRFAPSKTCRCREPSVALSSEVPIL